MAPDDDGPWPPESVPEMLAQMRLDSTSPHWERVRRQVYAFARKYGTRAGACLDDADDLTQEVMQTLLAPGKLETFDQRHASGAAPGDVPAEEGRLLRKRFLAWLAIITRHAWLNRVRYYDAGRRSAATSREYEGLRRGGDPISLEAGVEAAGWEPADPHADVAEQAQRQMLLEAVTSWLESLWTRNAGDARKVAQFLLVTCSDLSYDEVARRFNCEMSHVRDAVHRVRQRLRGLLLLYEADDPCAPDNSPDSSPSVPRPTRESPAKGTAPRRPRPRVPVPRRADRAPTRTAAPRAQPNRGAESAAIRVPNQAYRALPRSPYRSR